MLNKFKKAKQQDDTPLRRREAVSADGKRSSVEDLSERYTFRRNRTLTGSSSARIISSNELNAELRSPRAHVHHLTRLRRHLFAYFLLAIMLTFGLYTLLAQLVATEAIQVRTVPMLPANQAEAYKTSIEKYYTARPVERLRFMLKQNDLLHHVQSSHPEVKSLIVEQGSHLGEAAVTITSRKPIARWSINTDNQYVDGEGIVFSHSYFGDPGLQIIDNSGARADEGRLVASNRFLGFIGRVISGCSASGLSVATVTIPAGTTRQIAVTLKGTTTQYKLSVDRSAGQQVEDMTKVSRYFAANSLAPDYADLRITGKAYYK